MWDNEFICATLAAAARDVLNAEDQSLLQKRQERRFVSLVVNRASRPRRSRAVRWGVTAGGCAAVALLAWGLGTLLTSRPFTFDVTTGDGASVPGTPGDWIETTADQTIDIHFDQGSRFRMDTGGAVRILEASPQGVTIELARGNLFADVEGPPDTRWRINAGPFSVHVLGTVFSVDWNGNTSDVRVRVVSGVVLVQGSSLNHHGLRLYAGQQLRANGRTGEVSVETLQSTDHGSGSKTSTAVSATSESTARFATDSAGNATNIDTERDRDPSTISASPVPKAVQDHSVRAETPPALWKRLYDDGQFVAAVDAARGVGLDVLLATLDAPGLWMLADAARNARETALSNRILQTMRQRFTNDNKSRLAAFLIGRSVMDVENQSRVAARWFHTYLEESPHGEMAQEAYGRLMQIYSKNRLHQDARTLASRYLAHYPDGLYATRAKRLLTLGR